MSGLDFSSYFRDVHGVSPFPWQERLVRYLLEHGSWPDLVDLPTASGKTACLDIALFHLAWCIEKGESWRAARRIVFVVDRRIVVDAAAVRAERILSALEASKTEAVQAVAAALGRAGGASALVCQKLRGGMPRERGFALNPAQPMVITSTVDQIGSRLLFRGYGLSPYARPVHAGLLGFDTLLLLDEAHLSGPFAATIEAIRREQARAKVQVTPVQPIQLVSLSATGHSTGTTFGLDEQDLKHPVIRERRFAHKPVRLVETTAKPSERLRVLLRETLATYSELASIHSPAIAVIVNRVSTARALFAELHELRTRHCFTVELLTGRSRPLDRDRIAQRTIDRCGAGRNLQPDDQGVIVVATQTIEVGADLDFQGMLSECAALDALRQRFGRLNRMGKVEHARGVIVGGGDEDDDPIYGPALNHTWRGLNALATAVDGVSQMDFSIDAVDGLLTTVDTRLWTRPSRPALQLTPLYVELLAQTSPSPVHDPDIESLLHGLDSSPRDVQVVWRGDLPVLSDNDNLVLDSRELRVAQELLKINPPSSLETLALPLSAVRAWLNREKDRESMSDVEGAVVEGSVSDGREEPDHPRQALRWFGDNWQLVFAHQIRPGDIIVVPSQYGGCDDYGFEPSSTAAVKDLSPVARVALKRTPLVVITANAVPKLGLPHGWLDKVAEVMVDDTSPPFEWLDLESIEGDDLGPLLRSWPIDESIIDTITDHAGNLYALVLTSRRPEVGDISDEDISSSETVPVPLRDHNAGVGRKARELAASLGLPHQVVETLGRTGELHDIGKADPRFQAMLRGGEIAALPGDLLAKGVRRAKRRNGELAERHEAYSVALVRKHPEILAHWLDSELALYLIGSHHGRGRPLMPDRADAGTDLVVEVDHRSLRFEGAPRLGALGSGWPRLFWALNRRYGPWGLAYFEAVFRLADWLRSAEELQTR